MAMDCSTILASSICRLEVSPSFLNPPRRKRDSRVRCHWNSLPPVRQPSIMLPRRFPRGFRPARPSQFRQLGYMDYHDAQENLRPLLMTSRLKGWGKPGNEINPQSESMLYDGRIPQEITDLIFDYVLSPDAPAMIDTSPGQKPHDFCVRDDHECSSDEPTTYDPMRDADQASNEAGSTQDNATEQTVNEPLPAPSRGLLVVRDRQGKGFDWLRPDRNHKPTYSGWTILQTCRQIYLDAAKFLASNRELVLFEGRGFAGARSFADLARRVRNIPAQVEFQGLPSVRMYSQMYRLERTAAQFEPPRTTRSSNVHWHLRSLLSAGESPSDPVWRVLHNLETFHLTLRRTDWNRWEDNNALSINPYRGDSAAPDVEQMRRDMHATMEEGADIQFAKTSWGRMSRVMANLKELSITFETSEDKKGEMEEIVEWARTWRFEIMSWRHWLLTENDEVMAHLPASEEDKLARIEIPLVRFLSKLLDEHSRAKDRLFLLPKARSAATRWERTAIVDVDSDLEKAVGDASC
ncbi:hypothetical protein N0V82_004730 [Gnomoniopsis sp. IMI 355080]|nr:hypothetical protein N0V82_004730 [Gnomoniopsis sp. IMI 355080]